MKQRNRSSSISVRWEPASLTIKIFPIIHEDVTFYIQSKTQELLYFHAKYCSHDRLNKAKFEFKDGSSLFLKDNEGRLLIPYNCYIISVKNNELQKIFYNSTQEYYIDDSTS